MGQAKGGTTKGGRPKPVKKGIDTEPSAHGIRVEPCIDAALRSKYEAATAKKYKEKV